MRGRARDSRIQEWMERGHHCWGVLSKKYVV